MNKSKILYITGAVIGVGLIFADHVLWGVGVMFLGLFLSILADPEIADYPSTSYTTKTEKKPYYKDEFEEYQHYKHCKKYMRK